MAGGGGLDCMSSSTKAAEGCAASLQRQYVTIMAITHLHNVQLVNVLKVINP